MPPGALGQPHGRIGKMETRIFSGARVLITGHTGFKGFWLSRLLKTFGAEIHGLSLPPEKGSLFDRANSRDLESNSFLDITEKKVLEKTLKDLNPDIVIHLAAQPLVRRSYRDPILTFNTNVMGTANVLESVRNLNNTQGVIIVTSDKVYKYVKTGHAHTEQDELGGHDPYSASKSASEIIVSAWRNLISLESSKVLVSARAGNIIGGGDHSEDRLLPDLIRSFRAGEPAVLRNPHAIRPWQHVLDPLMGYLSIASRILEKKYVSDTYNFGPLTDLQFTVGEIANLACQGWRGNPGWRHQEPEHFYPESMFLWLDSSRACEELGWRPKLSPREAVNWTIRWEQATQYLDVASIVDSQIQDYLELTP